MARRPRVVVPDIPHHVTQRGNRKQQTFFEDRDYRIYKQCLKQACEQYEVRLWAYCLMPNHVHLIAVPKSKESLSKAMGRGHEAYSRYLNHKKGWSGLLWQSRFRSCPMDEEHLYAAARYIECNPVRAGMVDSADKYPWSSARAHLQLDRDDLIETKPLLSRINNWGEYLSTTLDEEKLKKIRYHVQTGHPMGSDTFINEIEQITGRKLKLSRSAPGRYR